MSEDMTDSTEVSPEFDIFAEISSFGDEPKVKGTRIQRRVFLKTYVDIACNGGNSVDVASELGISPQAVRQRVGKLIRQGVKLPKLGNICRRDTAKFNNEVNK